MPGFSFALAPNRKTTGSALTAGAGAGSSSGGSAGGKRGHVGGGVPIRGFGGDDEDQDEDDEDDGGAFGSSKRSQQGRAQGTGSSSKSSAGKGEDKPLSVFGGDEDEDEDGREKAGGDGRSRSGTRPDKGTAADPARLSNASNPVSRASRLAADQALAQDASIFEYDSVYDAMKTAAVSAKQKKAEADKAAGLLDDAGRPAPKYIDAFLQASVQRKRDRERAEAKKIQRERDAEGDEFADKEAFVTDAYREQMENIRKEEEEEAKRQAQNKSKGVQAFYSNLLSEQSAAHEAAVKAANAAAAATSASSGSSSGRTPLGPPRPSTSTANDDDGPAEDSETAVLARKIEAARASGLDVEINDDNQIVDNRSLLNKGLNFISKNKSKKPGGPAESSSRLLPPGGRGPASSSTTANAKSLSSAQSFNSAASRARQSEHMEAQLLEVQRKRAAEEELEREKARAKLMSVVGAGAGAGDKSREEREAERRKAKERALARRAKGGTAGAA
ncbi:hypothetical protein OC834_000634 [Tilletia horrida]|nr:hypothetical protein OC834_000634 [Tilletia horrida]